VPRVFLRMNQRQRQRVRRIGRGQFGEVQHPLHHFGDGEFLRRAVADDGLFHFAWGDFKNFNSSFGNRRHCCTARLAHDEGGLQILREEKSFDHADGRLMFAQNVAERLGNFSKAARAFPSGRTGNGALREQGWI